MVDAEHEKLELAGRCTRSCSVRTKFTSQEPAPLKGKISKSAKKRAHVKIEPEITAEILMKTAKREAPPNWDQVVANLREMRKKSDAPVDTMGCDKCQDDEAPLKVIRFQKLVALMLSSQTKDQVTHAAMQKLKAFGCTVDKISGSTQAQIGELIYPVSFWKNKAKFIKKTSEVLKEQYEGDIPRTLQELCKLPGVGPKMGHLCMQSAWGEVTGIGVDTHVHRISNRLGWVTSKTPEQTRKGLEGWLPVTHWQELNQLMVGFGQQICLPVKPLCGNCLNKELCPFGAHFKNQKIK